MYDILCQSSGQIKSWTDATPRMHSKIVSENLKTNSMFVSILCRCSTIHILTAIDKSVSFAQKLEVVKRDTKS